MTGNTQLHTEARELTEMQKNEVQKFLEIQKLGPALTNPETDKGVRKNLVEKCLGFLNESDVSSSTKVFGKAIYERIGEGGSLLPCYKHSLKRLYNEIVEQKPYLLHNEPIGQHHAEREAERRAEFASTGKTLQLSQLRLTA